MTKARSDSMVLSRKVDQISGNIYIMCSRCMDVDLLCCKNLVHLLSDTSLENGKCHETNMSNNYSEKLKSILVVVLQL